MKLFLIILVASAITGVSAMAAGSAQQGKVVFGSKCKTCHGPDGKGNPAIAKMMKVKMHELGSKEVKSKSEAELKKEIVQGNGKMMPVKGLSAGQLNDVIAYVRSLGKK